MDFQSTHKGLGVSHVLYNMLSPFAEVSTVFVGNCCHVHQPPHACQFHNFLSDCSCSIGRYYATKTDHPNRHKIASARSTWRWSILRAFGQIQ